MKYLYIILAFFSYCCETRPTRENAKYEPKILISNGKNSTDTIVGIINSPVELLPPNYSEKEYFLVIHGDTSRLSIIISSNNESGYITGKFDFDSKKNFGIERLTDTIAVIIDTGITVKNNIFPRQEITSSLQLRELKYLLKFIAKEFDLQKLRSLRFQIRHVPDFSEAIETQFLKLYNRKVEIHDGSKVAALIKNSYFTDQLNDILSDFKLSADKVSVSDIVLNSGDISKFSHEKTDSDGVIVFKMKRM